LKEMRDMADFGMRIAERDHPELARAWQACQAQMYSLDGGVTYQWPQLARQSTNRQSTAALRLAPGRSHADEPR
jgi:hypothetical protein